MESHHNPHDNSRRIRDERKEDAAFAKLKQKLSGILNKHLAKSRNSLLKAQEELRRCLGWDQLRHESTLLQANLYRWRPGMKVLEAADWEDEGRVKAIPLNPGLDLKEELPKRFKQVRKLQRGIPHARLRVCHYEDEIDAILKQIDALNQVAVMDDLLPWGQKLIAPPKSVSSKKQEDPPLPYQEFLSASGIKILVGKNARANDKVTFSCGKGGDWWMHASGYPGSHVVIKVKKGEEPDRESLQDAMQLALAYSKARGKEAEIVVTQCKYVSRMGGGHPGRVQISKHKTYFVRYDKERLQQIKSRHQVISTL